MKRFGTILKDEDEVKLVIRSNSLGDKNGTLEQAKGLKRPILLEIRSDLSHSYKYTNYALTLEEAKQVVAELNKMLDYLED